MKPAPTRVLEINDAPTRILEINESVFFTKMTDFYRSHVQRGDAFLDALRHGPLNGTQSVEAAIPTQSMGTMIFDWLRREKAGSEKEKSAIDWDDVVFEVDLLKSQEINLDYILELIFEQNKKNKSKSELIEEVRRLIRASLGNRKS